MKLHLFFTNKNSSINPVYLYLITISHFISPYIDPIQRNNCLHLRSRIPTYFDVQLKEQSVMKMNPHNIDGEKENQIITIFIGTWCLFTLYRKTSFPEWAILFAQNKKRQKQTTKHWTASYVRLPYLEITGSHLEVMCCVKITSCTHLKSRTWTFPDFVITFFCCCVRLKRMWWLALAHTQK